MRESIFRGKLLNNGEWAFGYFCEFANNRTGEQESYIQTIKQDGRIDLIHKIDPFTVGQYTGMVDKRIFEGDVFKYGFDEVAAIGVVKFGEYSFGSHFDMNNVGFYVEWNPRAMYYRSDLGFWLKQRKADIELIGNIYDNPELLGESSNE